MPDPSRNLETSPRLETGGCPRCGVRLAREFKYCPNCAYRLRPEIVPTKPSPDGRPALMPRLIALGGYLAFASMLLLVVYAGFSLFRQPETGPETQPRVILTRDPSCLPFGAGSLRRVDGGEAFYGVYMAAERAPPPEIFHVDDPFDLCLYEVTNDQYYEFLLDRARKAGHPVREWLFPKAWTRSTGKPEVSTIYDRRAGDLPVMAVYYQAALEFCAWYWEAKLRDPDHLVDLPTPLEYLRAARGDAFDKNFPWGRRIDEPGARARLDKGPLPVGDKEVGQYPPGDGFFALVGNAAEWVHGYVPNRVPMAAGWSHLDALYRGLERRSPFGDDGFVLVSRGEPRPDLGFRILIRSAPAWPEFTKVEPGQVHHMPAPSDRLRPPPLFDEEGNPRGEAGAVTFSSATRTVPRAFEITRAEITNRQYLHFLRSVSPRKTTTEMEGLIPSAWKRPNPWHWTKADPELGIEAWEDTVYLGPYGDPWKIPRVYEAGRENHPVEGVLLAQAKAYAAWLSNRLSRRCRLPTVGEFLRAGRGSGREPYPWGDSVTRPELVCTRGVDEEERTVSLLGRLGLRAPPLVGLVGNLPEYVWDPDWQEPDPQLPPGRWLLAGGCYRFPPELCTLDSFLDATWEYVEFNVQSNDEILNPLTFYAGFRVVREAGLF